MNKLFLYRLFILFGFISTIAATNTIHGQSFSRNEIKAAYLTEIPESVVWPNENHKSSFVIGVLGENPEMLNSLKLIARKKTIKNKAIEIKTYTAINQITNIDLLYITQDWNPAIKDVYNQINQKNILLVSDSCADKSYVMLNFIDTEESQLRFEINKSNLILEGFNLLPDILLIGGTEMDVAQLYKEIEREVADVKERLLRREKELHVKEEQLSSQQDMLAELSVLMVEQKKSIEDRETQLKELQSELMHASNQLTYSKELLMANSAEFREKLMAIQEKEKEVLKLSNLIEDNILLLSKQKKNIASQEKLLDQQSNEIGAQSHQIEIQRNWIVLGTLALVVLLTLLGFIFYINKARKKANDSLKDALTEVKEAQSYMLLSEKMSSLGQLTAGIAHEINNPVNFINTGVHSLVQDLNDLMLVLKAYEENEDFSPTFKAKISALKKELDFSYLEESIPQTCEDISIGVDRVTKIIEGLRHFSIKRKTEKAYDDLHSSLDSTLVLLQHNYKNKIELIKEYDPNLPEFYCFPGQINQVFLNLLTNAEQAIKEKGTVRITTKNYDEYITISISDTGMGIPEDIRNKIFEPFYTTKDIGSGTGLGLSISYGIIEKHGGELTFTSKVGEGTEFVTKLPKTEMKIEQ